MRLRFKIAGIAALMCVAFALVEIIRAFAGSSSEVSIIPLPQNAERRAGVFRFTAETCILADPAALDVAADVAERLRKGTGYGLAVDSPTNSRPRVPKGAIIFTTNKGTSDASPESYQL